MAELRRRVDADGVVAVSRRVHVSRQTLTAMLAGVRTQPATAIATRVYLAQRV